MILTDRIVFLQLQKSGCTYVEKILLTHFDAKRRGKHLPIFDDSIVGDRKQISSIRNPWDFYFSLWSFNCMGQGGNYERTMTWRFPRGLRDYRLAWVPKSIRLRQAGRHLWADLRKDREFYRANFADGRNAQSFRAWLKRTLDPAYAFDQFPDYGYSVVSRKYGLLTYLHLLLAAKSVEDLFTNDRLADYQELRRYLLSSSRLDKVIMFENLADDFLATLRLSGHDVSDTVMAAISSREKTNSSERHLTLAEAYDADTIELVRASDRLIVDAYGYAFRGGKGDEPVSGGRQT